MQALFGEAVVGASFARQRRLRTGRAASTLRRVTGRMPPSFSSIMPKSPGNLARAAGCRSRRRGGSWRRWRGAAGFVPGGRRVFRCAVRRFAGRVSEDHAVAGILAVVDVVRRAARAFRGDEANFRQLLLSSWAGEFSRRSERGEQGWLARSRSQEKLALKVPAPGRGNIPRGSP